MVLWCCGVAVLRCCGVVVLWCCGVAVLWCCGVVVLRCCGFSIRQGELFWPKIILSFMALFLVAIDVWVSQPKTMPGYFESDNQMIKPGFPMQAHRFCPQANSWCLEMNSFLREGLPV